MTCFVDTSALYAVLDADDANHALAASEWKSLLEAGVALVTTSYVLVETIALLQHRLGLKSVHTFREDISPLLCVHWVDAPLHEAGLAAVLAAQRRQLSLVDCVSFAFMRAQALDGAFTFDPHFFEQGFVVRGLSASRRKAR